MGIRGVDRPTVSAFVVVGVRARLCANGRGMHKKSAPTRTR